MTLSRKMNWAAALRTSVLSGATPKRATTPNARPTTELRSVAVEDDLEGHRLLAELGAWLILAGCSLLCWLVAAVAIGIV